MLVAVSNGALRGYLDTTTPLIVAAIAFVVDYSVDPQVVYPADPKGLGAAGAATVVAEWLSAGLFLGKFLTMKPAIFPILDFFPPWAEMAPVVRAGTQIFIRTVLLQGLLATSCIAAARIGPLDIAAHQVALQLWIPPSFITDAFSIAAQGLVADALGRNDRVRARELSQYLLKWGVALGGVLAVFCATAQIVYPDALPHFFTDDQGILDKVHPIVWLIAIMQPINGLVNVGTGVLQGAQDFSYQVLTMGLSAVFAGSLFFILRDEGLTAVWETLLAFQMMRALLFAYRFVEPLGPLAIKQRKEQKVLVGSAMDMWWNKNDSRTRKKKKKRRWFD
jgi:MATE family multidrug resistance protein